MSRQRTSFVSGASLVVVATFALTTSGAQTAVTAPVAATAALLAQPNVSVVFDEIDTGGDARLDGKLRDGAKWLEKAINDQEFRRRVLVYTSETTPTVGYRQAYREFPGHNIMGNDEVLAGLLGGNKRGGVIHLHEQVERKGSEVGHTEMKATADGMTYTSRAWLRGATIPEIADHLLHEQMHRVGFTHERDYSRDRCFSVPYAVGELACETVVRLGTGTIDDCDPTPRGKC
jgi:hypothetical protein